MHLGRDVLPYLTGLRAAGMTWRHCARALWVDTDHKVDVSDQTLRIWVEGRAARDQAGR
jgi:hypothetical protein